MTSTKRFHPKAFVLLSLAAMSMQSILAPSWGWTATQKSKPKSDSARKPAQVAAPFPGDNPKGGKYYDDAPPSDEYVDEDFGDVNDEVIRHRLEQKLREQAGGALPGTNPAMGGKPGAPAGPQGYDDYGYDTPGAGAGAPSAAAPAGGGTRASMGSAGPAGAGGGLILGTPSSVTGGKQKCLKLDPDTGYGPDRVANFDFPDADIVEIAKTLAKLTCLNFIIEKDVKGRVSIVSNSADMTIGDAWKAFLTALDINQITVIPSGKYLRLARQRDAMFKQLKIYSGKSAPETDALITRVIPLKYIDAEELRRVFVNIASSTTRFMAYQQTNTLIITDTGANIKKFVDLVALLDVEGYDEGLELIKIKYASADEISKLIDQLLPNAAGPALPGAPMPTGRGGRFGARRTKEGGQVSHIIADGRTNSLIVSANAKGFQQVKELVAKLDTKITANAGGSKIHVVYLQFADAEQVANTLNNLTQGAQTRQSSMPGIAGLPSPNQGALFEGNVKVAADKPTNSLVVTASPTDFTLVKRVLSKLDVPRDQVYVEAVVVEMAVNKSFDYGVSAFSKKSGLGFISGESLATALTNPLGLSGLVWSFKQGDAQTVSTGSGNITINSVNGIIRLLQQNTQANVLATPQLLTLDNQEASIEIGETVPLPTVTNVQGVGAQQTFTRERVSLLLKIKPQINKVSNFVKLDIDQKIDDFSNRQPPQSVSSAAFGTTTRASKTTVVVQDQDTAVLGGLIRDKIDERVTKIPVLGDIPLLGWLFRSKTTSTSKTNLLLFITPKIIKQYQTVRGILDSKIQERDEFIQRYNGGEDPYKEYKMKMIRSLPALSELKTNFNVENTETEEDESKL